MSKNNMITRLNYMGGENQQNRMNKDKLKSLKKALLYSYQAATAVLSDGREFRCLINPNKLSLDLDNKILSIPFKDICLNADRIGTTSQGEVDIEIKEGDVIKWKENNSHWIVYLQRLEETAYFRADLRRCHYQVTLSNGSKYWVYVRGPAEQSLIWTQSQGNYLNKLNYTLIVYITKNEETLDYFHRFSKVTINNQPWEVQAIDNISTPGLIELTLKEDYSNPIKDNLDQVVQDLMEDPKLPLTETENPYIYGLKIIYPYDTQQYRLENYNQNFDNGHWVIENETRKDMVDLLVLDSNKINIFVKTGKSGAFTLTYYDNDNKIASMNITVASL